MAVIKEKVNKADIKNPQVSSKLNVPMQQVFIYAVYLNT